MNDQLHLFAINLKDSATNLKDRAINLKESAIKLKEMEIFRLNDIPRLIFVMKLQFIIALTA